jgi:transcriptional regulator with XRE-family HTH domain
MALRPHADTELAKYLTRRVLELRPKTQADIAAEAGFANPNFLTMVKQGSSKLALDRVPALALALECDPAFLMRLSLEQAVGDTGAKALVEILGTPVTRNELDWLEELREASGKSDPRLTSRARAALRGIFGK